MIEFLYNGKKYSTWSLNDKLRKLKITVDDIQIIEKNKCAELDEDNGIKKYYFINNNTKETISSIYDNLDNLKDLIDINEWSLI